MTASELALEILQRNYDIETGELERKIRQNERQAVIKEIEGWLVEVVAQGWCTEKNSHKEMDPDLANAIVEIARAKLVEMKEGKHE